MCFYEHVITKCDRFLTAKQDNESFMYNINYVILTYGMQGLIETSELY